MNELTPDQAVRLGNALRAERAARSIDEISRAADLAPNTISGWENAKHSKVSPKLYKLAAHYRWTADSVRKVLSGERPDYIPPVAVLAPELSEAQIEDVLVGLPDGVSEAQLDRIRAILKDTQDRTI